MGSQISDLTKGFIATLNERNLVPKHLDLSALGGKVAISNCYQNLPSTVMNDHVYVGIHTDLNIALLKSLVEQIERLVILASAEPLPEHGTSGCAGYPTYQGIRFAQQRARANALNEAIERYVWSKWWDKECGAAVAKYSTKLISLEFTAIKDFAEKIHETLEVEQWYVVRPFYSGPKPLTIVLAQLKNGGFISGGACDNIEAEAIFRSFSEILRHALAAERLINHKRQAVRFYEKRLMHFASGMGSNLVHERLNRKPINTIILPRLTVDKEISHKNSDLIVIHRCLFENQPDFLGGPIERLCI